MPDVGIEAALDLSKSAIGSAAGMRRAEQQVRAVVAKAVDAGAALRFSVFTGSVATVEYVVACPTVAARYNNDKAKAGKVNHLKQVAADEVWAAVGVAKPGKGGKGTSVVGGWAALAEDPPTADQRHAVMISDGFGALEDVQVNLSGFDTVGMYAVGRLAETSRSTEETNALVERWRVWLTGHGAREVTVTSGQFQ